MCCHGNAASSCHLHELPFLPLFLLCRAPAPGTARPGRPVATHSQVGTTHRGEVTAAPVPTARLQHGAPTAALQHQVCH